MSSLQEQLRQQYQAHAMRVSAAVYGDIRAQWSHFETNYGVFRETSATSRVLEIGSGSGSLLAWLKHLGYTQLAGIDVAAEEVARAQNMGLPVKLADAAAYLGDQPSASLDVVVLKAVLEHLPKSTAARLLQEMARVVSPQGFVLIDVPNMDWLLASHERYMDMTHEIGYTRESLSQLLGLFFADVKVHGSREGTTSLASRLRLRIVRPLAVRTLRFFLRVIGEGASDLLFDSRSIIAVAKAPKS